MKLTIPMATVQGRFDTVYWKQLTPADVAIEAARALNFKIHRVERTGDDLILHVTHTGDAACCALWVGEKLGLPTTPTLTTQETA